MNYAEALAFLEDKIQPYAKERYNVYNDDAELLDRSYSSYDFKPKSDVIKRTIDNIRNYLIVNYLQNGTSFETYFTKSIIDQIVKSAVITGCTFVRVSKEDNGDISIYPYDSMYATGELSYNGYLKNGISIDSNIGEKIITYYTSDENGSYERTVSLETEKIIDEKEYDNVKNKSVLVPIIINQNALKPFGSSLITRAMISSVKELKKTKIRREQVSDIIANAQDYLLGVSKDFKKQVDDKTYKTMKDVLLINKTADGDTPNLDRDTQKSTDSYSVLITNIENSIKYDETSDSFNAMIQSIRGDIELGINRVCKIILEMTGEELDGHVKVIFKNPKSALMTGDDIIKINTVSPNYFGKEQLDEVFGLNGGEPTAVQKLLAMGMTPEQLAKKQTE